MSGTRKSCPPTIGNLTAFRWWQLSEIAGHTGPELFSPRDLTAPLTALLTAGTPDHPVQLGL